MKKLFVLGALSLCLLTSARAASADTFQFTFTGSLFSGTGYIDATEIGKTNKYDITSVFDGSVKAVGGSASAITGLLGDNKFQGNDNILIFPGTAGVNSPAYFDASGVSFSLANGNDVNLNDTFFFENAVGGPARGGDLTELDGITVARAVAPTPEPSSLMLLGTGILGVAGAARRKFVKA